MKRFVASSAWALIAAAAFGALASDPELRARAEAEVTRLRAAAAKAQAELPTARKKAAEIERQTMAQLPALRAAKETCEANLASYRVALGKQIDECRVRARIAAAEASARAASTTAELQTCLEQAATNRTACEKECVRSVQICKRTTVPNSKTRATCFTRDVKCKEACGVAAEQTCADARAQADAARDAVAATAGQDPCLPLIQQRDGLEGKDAACGEAFERAEDTIESVKADVAELEARVAVGAQASESYVADALTCGRLGMTYIPAGAFTVGDGVDRARVGNVSVQAFCIDRAEVTTASYEGCVALGKCTPPGAGEGCNSVADARGDHPINCVDWMQASTYCEAIGLRLPSEFEWEYAARGLDSRLYPWGNEAPRNQLCWDGEGNHVGKSRRRSTCPVHSHAKGNSPFGLADMAGNVSEWTSSPWAATDGDRVSRGGSWTSLGPAGVRAALRDGAKPGLRSADLGFRCARSAMR
jgi:formylglycine-generating enzyme required for sulfatase activity